MRTKQLPQHDQTLKNSANRHRILGIENAVDGI